MNKEELIAKLKEAKSADELIAFAKENGVEITPEKAKELFEQLSGGELTDDMLDAVSGGRQAQEKFEEVFRPVYGNPLERSLNK